MLELLTLLLALSAPANAPADAGRPAELQPVARPAAAAPEGAERSVRTPCVEGPLTVLPGVYLGVWEDTSELCATLAVTPATDVLDIGTGNGVLAIAALERGARSAVATDINPSAVDNARLNASRRQLGGKLDARLAPADSAGAYSVIGKDERFDLILCNCPAFDADVASYDEANAFDPGHALVISLFKGLKAHLKPRGRLLMTYWSGAGIGLLKRLAAEHDLRLRILKTVGPGRSAGAGAALPDREKLYRIPNEKIRDARTGHEQTLIVEVVPRPRN